VRSLLEGNAEARLDEKEHTCSTITSRPALGREFVKASGASDSMMKWEIRMFAG